MISVYYGSKEVKFFDLAQSFYPLKELVDGLNEDVDIRRLGDKINLIQRYRRNSPIDFDHSYSERVDFKRIFEVKLKSITSPNKLMHILFESTNINSALIFIFIRNFSPSLIKRAYFILNKNERKRLFNLLPENQIKRDIRKIEKEVKQQLGKGKSIRAINQFRMLIFSDYYYYGEIYVDAGAENAIKRGWINLLPAGITRVSGNFDAGVIVAVKSKYNHLLAVGLSEYSSDELKIIAGHSSSDFYELLGYYKGSAAIKYDLLLKFFNRKKQQDKWKRK